MGPRSAPSRRNSDGRGRHLTLPCPLEGCTYAREVDFTVFQTHLLSHIALEMHEALKALNLVVQQTKGLASVRSLKRRRGAIPGGRL